MEKKPFTSFSPFLPCSAEMETHYTNSKKTIYLLFTFSSGSFPVLLKWKLQWQKKTIYHLFSLPPFSPFPPRSAETETLHTSAKKLSIVSDASTTSDEEPWKREGTSFNTKVRWQRLLQICFFQIIIIILSNTLCIIIRINILLLQRPYCLRYVS